MNEPQEYRLRWRGRETGPFPLTEINRQLDEHEIGTGHEIFYEDDWITVAEFLAALAAPAAPVQVAEPPPPPPPAPLRVKAPSAPIKVPVVNKTDAAKAAEAGMPATVPRPHRRMLFALLAIVAGFAGVHNFYARQWLTGLLQLLLSVATFLMGFGIIASWLWAMAEAVFVRNDGYDIEMI